MRCDESNNNKNNKNIIQINLFEKKIRGKKTKEKRSDLSVYGLTKRQASREIEKGLEIRCRRQDTYEKKKKKACLRSNHSTNKTTRETHICCCCCCSFIFLNFKLDSNFKNKNNNKNKTKIELDCSV